jgi:hypothetical protein
MFPYGNPIILQNSGRVKTDSLNESRIEIVLDRFEEWSKAKKNPNDFTFIINK